MLDQKNITLQDALKATGQISEAALSRAIAASAQSNRRLEETLVELGLMKDEDLAAFLADWLDLPLVTEGELRPLENLPLDLGFLRRSDIAPVQMDTDTGQWKLAFADPRNDDLIRTVEYYLGAGIDLCVASRRTISDALGRLSPDTDIQRGDYSVEEDIERLVASANDGPVVALVQDLIARAVDTGASDIHIEALDTHAQIRYRTDGQLRRDRTISASERRAVVSRLKLMADLNISELRHPQDGRIRLAVRGRNIDLRLSTLPTQYGESAVLRVLDQSRLNLTWGALGFPPDKITALERLIRAPHGIILVTGPTGSGKTTTLYTALSQLDAEALKIITIEDPVEYSLPGINQVQVEPQIDMSFASALRAVLRQDPDVVLVGEIRDQETAEHAVRAALMGRLVFSTVHTNSAIGAITRLRDLGVPSFLLGSTLRAILSQRLVRKYCGACHGEGCADCGDTGYAGRTVVSELLEMDGTLSGLVSDGAQEGALTRAAEAAGFRPISVDAARCVEDGVSSAAEVSAVLGDVADGG